MVAKRSERANSDSTHHKLGGGRRAVLVPTNLSGLAGKQATGINGALVFRPRLEAT